MIGTTAQLIDKLQEQGFFESIMFDDPDLTPAVIGYTDDGNVVYSRAKMQETLHALCGMNKEQSDEWIEGDCSPELFASFGLQPIIVNEFIE